MNTIEAAQQAVLNLTGGTISFAYKSREKARYEIDSIGSDGVKRSFHVGLYADLTDPCDGPSQVA